MKKLNEKDKLDIIKLSKEGLSSGTIAKRYNVTGSAIRYILKQYGIELKNVHPTKLTSEQKEQICSMYSDGTSIRDLADYYEVCSGTICSILNQNGFQLKKIITPEQKVHIWDMYNHGISAKDISEYYDVDVTTIQRILKEYRKDCEESLGFEDFEISIDGYAEVINNLNAGKGYTIEYKDKGEIKREIIDRESILGLAGLGYIVGYTIGNNELSDRYLLVGPSREGKMQRGTLSKGDVIKHITNIESLPDKRIFKLDIKKLIFGDCNILKGVVVEFNGVDKKLSIDEYRQISINRYYSPYDDDYIKVAKDTITVEYKPEYADFLNKEECKARYRILIRDEVVTLHINGELNYITALTFLKDTDIELCIEYSENQKHIDKFISKLKSYRKKIELCKDDNIKIVKFYNGTSTYNGLYELHIGKTKVLTDTCFSSSALYRGITYKLDDTADIGNVVKGIKTTRTYDNKTDKTEFTMSINYELLETMKTVNVA